MRTLHRICLFLMPLFLAGCVMNPTSHLKQLPPGSYSTVKAVVTGKFSSTQFEGENVVIGPNGEYSSGHLHLRHSNVYVPLVELELTKAPPIQ